MSLRVCQFAFIGSDNLGDEAIFEAVHSAIQSFDPERVTVLSMSPERTRRLALKPNTRVLSARSLVDTLQAIRDSDVFVCGGGGLFQDHTSIYNPLRYLSRVLAAVALGKRVFIYAVSVGPLENPLNRRLTREILSRAHCVTVRDSGSKRLLVELGVPEHLVFVTSDPVVNHEAHAAPAGSAERRIVVCLRHWFDTVPWLPVSVVNALGLRSRENTQLYDHFIGELAKTLDALYERKKTPLLFVPFWHPRDTRVHHDVVERMRFKEHATVVDRNLAPDEAGALIASAEFVVAMRLHSLILAVAAKRPFFALDYSKKVHDFLEEVVPGQSERVSASPEKLSAQAVSDKLAALDGAWPFGPPYEAAVDALKLRERENIELLGKLMRG